MSKRTPRREKYSFFYILWVADGDIGKIFTCLLECFFPSAVQNRISWKQTEWHVYKYGCLPSGQASQPVPHWPHHFMVEPCNFREWGEKKNQREIIKDRSAAWTTCKVFFFFFCAEAETGRTECTQQRSWIKHDQIKAKHAENTGKVRKNPGHNYGWRICQECTN